MGENALLALHESDIIFSSATNDIKRALGELKRSSLSITNRLRSIETDAAFVKSIAQACKLPLISNERCGSWYIHPDDKETSAYFKSTDGHFGQWSFNLRRLNLHILETIGRHSGCIVVDSTRRGKSMPDALSKTVPIWICVLNRLLFPDIEAAGTLRTPCDVVSRSEYAQILNRIPTFMQAVEALKLDLAKLRHDLVGRPMKPIWITPATDISLLDLDHDGQFHPVVLCTASNSLNADVASRGFYYVQGAADDSESWAHGLEPAIFWRHHDELLKTNEDDLPEFIQGLVSSKETPELLMRSAVLVKPTTNLFIANNGAAGGEKSKYYHIIISSGPNPIATLSNRSSDRYLHLNCSTGKTGSRQLRKELPKLTSMQAAIRSSTNILVTCPSGRDFAVGIALAILCENYSDNGTSWGPFEDTPSLSKTTIKHRLSWIMASLTDAAPSRATLQSVNSFLLS